AEVAGEGGATHRRRTVVADAAAEGAGGVAGEGAAAHRQHPADAGAAAVGGVVDAAAVACGGGGAEGGGRDPRRPAELAFGAAAIDGGVAGEDDVADCQRPEVVDAAAIAVEVGASVAPGDRQAGDGHRLAGLDLEDAGEIAAADGQLGGAGAGDGQVVGDVE